MLVGWANQEKTGQVGVLVENLPRVGVPGEDWTRGVPEEDLAPIKAGRLVLGALAA